LGIVATIILILKLLGKVEIRWKWLLLSLALFILYFLAIIIGIPLEPIFGQLSWNWGGKLLAIFLWMFALIATLRLKPGFKMADAGFTFRQHQGSIKPTLIVIVVTLTFHLLLTYALGGSSYDTEELWFQGLMPGLDEEPMFRGILLYFLTLALISSRINLLGAHLNLAGLLLVIVFGLAHGLQFAGGAWNFSAVSILITGLYGFVLLWIRERTGSLVFPIVAHNAINFLGQFVPAP